MRVNVADGWSERGMTLSREILQREKPSNNELQEVSRGRSSEEVPVMGMERRTEPNYQLLKSKLKPYAKLRNSKETRTMSKQERSKVEVSIRIAKKWR